MVTFDVDNITSDGSADCDSPLGERCQSSIENHWGRNLTENPSIRLLNLTSNSNYNPFETINKE